MLQLLTLIHLLYLTHFGIFSLLSFFFSPFPSQACIITKAAICSFRGVKDGTYDDHAHDHCTEQKRDVCLFFVFHFIVIVVTYLLFNMAQQTGSGGRCGVTQKAPLLFKLRTLCTLVDKAHFMPLQIKWKTSMLLFDMALPPSRMYQTNEAKLTTIILHSTENKVDSEPN